MDREQAVHACREQLKAEHELVQLQVRNSYEVERKLELTRVSHLEAQLADVSKDCAFCKLQTTEVAEQRARAEQALMLKEERVATLEGQAHELHTRIERLKHELSTSLERGYTLLLSFFHTFWLCCFDTLSHPLR